MHTSKNNNDIDLIIIFNSRLHYDKLYKQLCNMFKCDVYLCECNKYVYKQTHNIMNIYNIKNMCCACNVEMYKLN